MNTTNVTLRLDANVKQSADRLFKELGMSTTTAINIFLRQAIREQGMPFEATCNVPNRATRDAIREADSGKDLIGPFDTISDLMEELNA